MKPVSYFITDGQTVDLSAVSVFWKFGKVNLLLLLVFPTTYVGEQGFSQVLNMRNK